MRSRAKPCQDRPIPRLRPSQIVRRSAILEAGRGQERASRAAEPRAKRSSCGFAEAAAPHPARLGIWRRCTSNRSNRTAVPGWRHRLERARHGDDRRYRHDRANALQSKGRRVPDRHSSRGPRDRRSPPPNAQQRSRPSRLATSGTAQDQGQASSPPLLALLCLSVPSKPPSNTPVQYRRAGSKSTRREVRASCTACWGPSWTFGSSRRIAPAPCAPLGRCRFDRPNKEAHPCSAKSWR